VRRAAGYDAPAMTIGQPGALRAAPAGRLIGASAAHPRQRITCRGGCGSSGIVERGPCRGFSMMELAAVLAVMAILATLAIPSMLDRIVREQVKAALPLADIAKRPIGLAWSAGIGLPADNEAAGLPVADKIVSNYISSLKVQDGAIHLTFGNQANATLRGKVLTLRPAVVADAPVVPIAWICGNADVPGKMTVQGVDLTDVDARLLPFECKSDKAG
jgi:type IV pilus assembly protein PilA